LNDQKGNIGAEEEIAPSTLSALTDQGALSKDTQTDCKKKTEKEGMETDVPYLAN
jgi:hypothetical protein